MKFHHCLYFLLIVILPLSACMSARSAVIPTEVNKQPSATIISTTLTPIPTSTIATTPISSTTLQPEQAKATITDLLREPVDCSAPCFWNITPEQTTLGQAKNIFSHLGLQITSNTYQGKDFSGINYDFESGLSISVILTVQNELVENLRVKILPEKQKTGASREWLAYSPETLIKRYGPPSRVEFAIAWGPGTSSYFQMVMYFDSVHLIVEYDGQDTIPWQQKSSPQVCPLTTQFEIVRLWMGKDPIYPPANAVPLEDATGITMEEFSRLMTGNPEGACFTIKGEKFP